MTTRQCLVLHSADEAAWLDQLYQPACEAIALQCESLNAISPSGRINSAVLQRLGEVDVVVADLVSRDPNVFYALGVAHALGKPAVVIAASETGVPFDPETCRVLVRSQIETGEGEVSRHLSIADLSIAISAALNSSQRTPFPGRVTGRPANQPRAGTPLEKVIDMASLAEPVREFLDEHGIGNVEDLPRLSLDDLAANPAVTRQALRGFVKELSRSRRYPDEEALQQFVIKRGIFL